MGAIIKVLIRACRFYIHSLFHVACSRSPLSKGSIFLQPAHDTAREQVTFYLTGSDIAISPGPGAIWPRLRSTFK